MKKLWTYISIGAVILVVISFTSLKSCNQNSVSQELFEQTHTQLNKRIDTLNYKLDSVQSLVSKLNLTTTDIQTRVIVIEKNIDTLKVGQIIIYDELTNFTTKAETKGNWANTIINWLN